MNKCYRCRWITDKCRNPNSKNYGKFIDDIKLCKPMLIDRYNNNIKPYVKDRRSYDDSI